MTGDAIPESTARDSLEVSAPATGKVGFWLHAVAWFLFYLTVVIAWGERNSWPSELLLCILSLPLTTLVASTLFQTQEFRLAIDPSRSQQEQLIAALVLAVGLASGQMLLMTLGLLCLGIAWLRPVDLGVDWSEWLKIPLLYLTALPFWLDFEGSRLPVVTLLGDPTRNPVFHLPLALSTTQAHVLGYCGLMGMALFLRGRGFWLALPFLPVYLVIVSWLPSMIPGWRSLPVTLASAMPWLLGLVVLLVGSRSTEGLASASRQLVSGQTLRRWFEGRRYPPWLAVLVVAVMQALPTGTLRVGALEIAGFVATILLVLVLLGLRVRTPRGPIHSRSVAMVAGGLALTLLAEFATHEPLRHLALAFVVIGLVSWHCFWPLRLFVLAGLLGVVALGLPADLMIANLEPGIVAFLRLAIVFGLLIAITWICQQPLPLPGATGYGDTAWIPSKRFALILLGLMMLFQTASAFWPEHEIPVSDAPPRSLAEEEPTEMPATGQPGSFRVPSPLGPVQVSMAYPRKNPYLLESPERTLRRRGWNVVRRVRAAHPRGEAISLHLERQGSHATAMWWFELGDRAFANHLYARRVLWSGWHLADRHLRLVRLESTAISRPEDLIAIAERENWFANRQINPPPRD